MGKSSTVCWRKERSEKRGCLVQESILKMLRVLVASALLLGGADLFANEYRELSLRILQE